MNQPVPRYVDADLDRVIAREFPQETIPEVRGLLARYGQEPWQREVARVQMACLKCAKGSLEELARFAEDACRDYWDVLLAAEYPRYAWARTEEAKREAIESDWDQLQAWLDRR